MNNINNINNMNNMNNFDFSNIKSQEDFIDIDKNNGTFKNYTNIIDNEETWNNEFKIDIDDSSELTSDNSFETNWLLIKFLTP